MHPTGWALLGLLTVAAGFAAAEESASAPPPSSQTLESGLPLTATQQAMHFDHAALHFVPDLKTHRLSGEAALDFTALQPLDQLQLNLDRNLAISGITLDGKTLPTSDWSNPQGLLSIHLPRPLPSGHHVHVDIRYAGHPLEAKHAPWDGGFVWSRTEDGQPWMGTAVEGEGCDIFWPCIDHPEGKPALVDTWVTVPLDLAAPGNGRLIDIQTNGDTHTYHWQIHDPNTYGVTLNVGPFEELKADYHSRYGNTIPMQFWYLRGHAEQARQLFAEFPTMLDFFESEIGPYPFGSEKVGVVETPYEGMEHQTINAYGNGYAKSPYGFDWLMQHEFSHEWFGNQVTNADWDDMWIHEAFATYMQPLYGQYLRGDIAYFAMLQSERVMVTNRVPIVSGHTQTEEQVYDAKRGPGNDIYYKGSLMLHSLRGLIGDQAFFESIRRLVYGRPDPKPGNFSSRYADTRDFIKIVDQVTGKSMDWFFQVYLYQAALPQLEVQRHGGQVSLAWHTGNNTPFPMPVELQIGQQTRQIDMSHGPVTVAVPAGELLIVDPHSKLLRDQPGITDYQQWLKLQQARHAPIPKPW
ncbi:M1 family metallopeptidase [Frateuria aurantia]